MHFNAQYLHCIVWYVLHWCGRCDRFNFADWGFKTTHIYLWQYDVLQCLLGEVTAEPAYRGHSVVPDLWHSVVEYGMVTAFLNSQEKLHLFYYHVVLLSIMQGAFWHVRREQQRESTLRWHINMNLTVRLTALIYAKQRNSLLVSISVFMTMTTTAKCACIIHN